MYFFGVVKHNISLLLTPVLRLFVNLFVNFPFVAGSRISEEAPCQGYHRHGREGRTREGGGQIEDAARGGAQRGRWPAL